MEAQRVNKSINALRLKNRQVSQRDQKFVERYSYIS